MIQDKHLNFCLRIILLVLFFTSVKVNGNTEEVTGTILFEPLYEAFYGRLYTYSIDTTGNGIDDTNFSLSDFYLGKDIVDRLRRYLIPGAKVVYENDSHQPFTTVGGGRIIYIITTDGRLVEPEKMFSPSDIELRFPWLWKKLVRENRVKQ